MMRRVSGSALFAVGCAAGVALATIFDGAGTSQSAIAQVAAGGPDGGPYYISSWGDGTNHGAYLINTHTGDVWSVVQGSPLQALGGPAEATPKQ